MIMMCKNADKRNICSTSGQNIEQILLLKFLKFFVVAAPKTRGPFPLTSPLFTPPPPPEIPGDELWLRGTVPYRGSISITF